MTSHEGTRAEKVNVIYDHVFCYVYGGKDGAGPEVGYLWLGSCWDGSWTTSVPVGPGLSTRLTRSGCDSTATSTSGPQDGKWSGPGSGPVHRRDYRGWDSVRDVRSSWPCRTSRSDNRPFGQNVHPSAQTTGPKDKGPETKLLSLVYKEFWYCIWVSILWHASVSSSVDKKYPTFKTASNRKRICTYIFFTDSINP